jgi:hypothetical protein
MEKLRAQAESQRLKIKLLKQDPEDVQIEATVEPESKPAKKMRLTSDNLK